MFGSKVFEIFEQYLIQYYQWVMTSVGKDYVFTLVLVHIVRFGSITQSLWYWYTYPSGY